MATVLPEPVAASTRSAPPVRARPRTSATIRSWPGRTRYGKSSPVEPEGPTAEVVVVVPLPFDAGWALEDDRRVEPGAPAALSCGRSGGDRAAAERSAVPQDGAALRGWEGLEHPEVGADRLDALVEGRALERRQLHLDDTLDTGAA